MSAPILVLHGRQGSGKSTVAGILAARWNGVVVALADPMKRLARDVFEFADDSLWGPSEARSTEHVVDWRSCRENLVNLSQEHLEELFPRDSEKQSRGYNRLLRWFDRLRRDHQGRALTPRACLQTLGTSWGRGTDPDVWARVGLDAAVRALSGPQLYDSRRGFWDPSPGMTHHLPRMVVVPDGRFRNEVLKVLMAGGRAWEVLSPASGGGSDHESEVQEIPRGWFSESLTNYPSGGLGFLEADIALKGWPFWEPERQEP